MQTDRRFFFSPFDFPEKCLDLDEYVWKLSYAHALHTCSENLLKYDCVDFYTMQQVLPLLSKGVSGVSATSLEAPSTFIRTVRLFKER